jgi:hypothetical protein
MKIEHSAGKLELLAIMQEMRSYCKNARSGSQPDEDPMGSKHVAG